MPPALVAIASAGGYHITGCSPRGPRQGNARGSTRGISASGLAEELQADVPQVVAAVHVARVGLGELAGVEAVAGLFHDDVGAAVRAGHEQPGVVGEPLVGGAVPADPASRLELVHRAVGGGTEGDPVEGDAGA